MQGSPNIRFMNEAIGLWATELYQWDFYV